MADDAGALLVRAGLITADHLAAARVSQQQDGGTISEHLVVAGMVSDEKLTEFYRTRLLVPQVHPNTLARLSPSVVGLLPADLAAELRAVPVALDKEGNLTVAMSDPSDRHAVDEIGFFTGKYVVRAVATQMQIAWCLAQYYDCLTELGERLLQPVAAGPAPEPAPEPVAPPAPASTPATVAPLYPQRGDTGRIEAARHKVLAPVTTPPPNTAIRPSAATLDRAAQPAPAAARIAPAPAPLPRGAFGGNTPDMPVPPPSSLWQAPAAPAAVTAPAAPPPAPVIEMVATPADEAPPPIAAAGRSPFVGGPPSPSESAPEATESAFDDTPSIIISIEATRPTRLRPALPDPPELAARAGEMQLIELANRLFEPPTATIEINFGPEPEPSDAAVAAAPEPVAAAPEPVAAAPEPVEPLAVPVAAPGANTAPMTATAPVPAPPDADAIVEPAHGRPLSEPIIEVVRAEASGPVDPAVPVAVSPEAETRRLSGPALAIVAQLEPPGVPEVDAVPAPIADPWSADTESSAPTASAAADDRAAADRHGADHDRDADHDRATDDDDQDDDDQDDRGPALIHARKPEAVIEDEIDDASAAEPILLTTPRRSGPMATAQMDPAAPAPRPQAIVVESIDDASGPVLLTDRMRRREARRREKGTMIGIGLLGPIPRSIEPTPSPYALPSHAAPEPQAMVREPFAEDAMPTVRATVRFEEHDALDDGWGAPGTTIPPGFLGAVPSAIDDRPSEPASVPIAAPAPAAPTPVAASSTARYGSSPTIPPAAGAGAGRSAPVTAPQPVRERGSDRVPAALPAIPPPRLTPPGARPAATLTPLNRNRTVAGVPDPSQLAELLESASQRLVELLHGLDTATHRDHVIAMLVDFVGESHHRVAFLALRGDELTPFMQVPQPTGPTAQLDLRAAATFQDVIGTRLPYRGPISDAASRELVRALFGSATDEMLVVPVAVRDRVVGVIYADGRHRHSFDEHVTVAGRAAGLALQRILKDRKS